MISIQMGLLGLGTLITRRFKKKIEGKKSIIYCQEQQQVERRQVYAQIFPTTLGCWIKQEEELYGGNI